MNLRTGENLNRTIGKISISWFSILCTMSRKVSYVSCKYYVLGPILSLLTSQVLEQKIADCLFRRFIVH